MSTYEEKKRAKIKVRNKFISQNEPRIHDCTIGASGKKLSTQVQDGKTDKAKCIDCMQYQKEPESSTIDAENVNDDKTKSMKEDKIKSLKKLTSFSVESITRNQQNSESSNHTNRKRNFPRFDRDVTGSDANPTTCPSAENGDPSCFFSHYCYPKRNCLQHQDESPIKPHPLNLLQSRILDRLDQTFPHGKLRFLEEDNKEKEKPVTKSFSNVGATCAKVKSQLINKMSSFTAASNLKSDKQQNGGNLSSLPRSSMYKNANHWNSHSLKRPHLQSSGKFRFILIYV